MILQHLLLCIKPKPIPAGFDKLKQPARTTNDSGESKAHQLFHKLVDKSRAMSSKERTKY